MRVYRLTSSARGIGTPRTRLRGYACQPYLSDATTRTLTISPTESLTESFLDLRSSDLRSSDLRSGSRHFGILRTALALSPRPT